MMFSFFFFFLFETGSRCASLEVSLELPRSACLCFLRTVVWIGTEVQTPIHSSSRSGSGRGLSQVFMRQSSLRVCDVAVTTCSRLNRNRRENIVILFPQLHGPPLSSLWSVAAVQTLPVRTVSTAGVGVWTVLF